jgi:hypothetical protein
VEIGSLVPRPLPCFQCGSTCGLGTRLEIGVNIFLIVKLITVDLGKHGIPLEKLLMTL